MNIQSSVEAHGANAIIRILHDSREQSLSLIAQTAAARARVNLGWRQDEPKQNDAVSVIARLVMDAQGNSEVSIFAQHAAAGIRTGGGDDRIVADVDMATIRSGRGDDEIVVRASSGDLHSVDHLDSGAGDDDVRISSQGGVLRTSTGGGDDNLAIASRSLVWSTDTGRGDDTVRIAAESVQVVRAGKGDDTIEIEAEQNVWRVDGGEGDDTISVSGQSVHGVYGGEGDDIIQVSAASIQMVSGGRGDDSIVLDSTAGNVSSLYLSEGDGNDTVETNGPLVVFRSSADGTATRDAAVSSMVRNDDGSLSIFFEGSSDSLTVRFTGDMANREIVAETHRGRLILSVAPETQPAAGTPDFGSPAEIAAKIFMPLG